MTKDVSVFLNVRMQSRRCANKMLRPFAGSTLIDIALEKLSALSVPRIYFGAYEDALIEKAARYPKFTVIRRSQESAMANTDARKVFEVLNHLSTPSVLWINPCLVFLTVETIERAYREFLPLPYPSMTAVIRDAGWFYDASGKALTNRHGAVDTAAATDHVFKVCHAFHFYNREFFLKEGKYWSNLPDDPALFPIDWPESVDIDTEDEFAYAEWLYTHRQRMQTASASV